MHTSSIGPARTVSGFCLRVDASVDDARRAVVALYEHGHIATAERYGVDRAIALLARTLAVGIPVVVEGHDRAARELARALGAVDPTAGSVFALAASSAPLARVVDALLEQADARGPVRALVVLDGGELGFA